jgi:hypothetical protein
MPGPAPKPAAQRQRANRHTTATTVMVGPAVRVDLPADYHDLTRAWWTTIWGSPIADEWVDADVPGLVALAQLVEDFWRAEAADRAKRHAEVRMASREYGLSPFSRRQLQWEIRRVEGAKPARPTGPRRSSRTVLSVLSGKSA